MADETTPLPSDVGKALAVLVERALGPQQAGHAPRPAPKRQKRHMSRLPVRKAATPTLHTAQRSASGPKTWMPR